MEENSSGQVRPWLLVALIIVVLGAAGFFTWQYWAKLNPSSSIVVATPTLTPTRTVIPVSPTPTISVAQTYSNSTYGFKVTFPAGWEDYKVKVASIEGTTVTYYVEMPTKFPSSPDGDSTADKGYFSPFAISVYTLDQWDKAQKEEGPKDTLITKNSKYVFAWAHGQWAPEDFKGNDDINTIIDSFTIK